MPFTANRFQNAYPGRFLFIHDTFYVDAASDEEDLTREIREFMARKRDEIRPHGFRLMQGVRFSELTLRLGQPYLFQHQGICEHQLIFSDLRLLNASDEQLPERYPIKVYDTRSELLCRVCRRVMAV
jgi:snRNA-activating protein complex subunit 3